MKLIAFRIKNFRAIVDTGWQSLSPDNVTCLIGQNESGKTSVLEGLKVFYTGIISEDVLRSDLTLPEISCRFSIPQGWLIKVTENPGTELKELLSGLTSIELTRSWIADLTSVITVSGAISQYLDSLEDAWRTYLGDVTLKLEEELNHFNGLEMNLKSIKDEELLIRSKFPARDIKKRKSWFFKTKTIDFADTLDSHYPGLKNQLNELEKKKEEIAGELSKKQSVKKSGEKWENLLGKCTNLENHLGELSLKLEERHQKMTLLIRPDDNDRDLEWKNVLNDYRKTRRDRDLSKLELDRHIALSAYIMEGDSEDDGVTESE